MSLVVENLTPAIGAEIKADKAALLSGALTEEIMRHLTARGVIIFRGMKLDDEEHLRFAESLGTIRKEFGEKMMKVTFDKKENPRYADYFHGTFTWHMDGTWDDVPPLASALRPQRLATWGGQTEFANTYAAYEGLSPDDQAQVDTLRGVHTMEAAMRPSVPDPDDETLAAWKTYPSRSHPLVWNHRSGRRSLAMSTSLSHLEGIEPGEGKALLARLWEWAVRPEFVYRHEWQMDDLLIWDNTGTMHRALPYDHDCGRRLHRVTLEGVEPVAAT